MADSQKIWAYYCEAAKKTGMDANGKKAAYSLEDFFDPEGYQALPAMAKAFLEGRTLTPEAKPSRDEMMQHISTVTPPYPAQIDAIENALTEQVSLVQGPPGTGKTEMILNLVSVLHGIYPARTIAIVSSNAEAVDNIIEKIESGKDKDEKLAAIDRCFAQLGSKDRRAAWWSKLAARGLDNSHLDVEKAYKVNPASLQNYPIFSSTIHSLRRIFQKGQKGTEQFAPVFDYVIVDECSQIGILLGLVTMQSAGHLVLIGDNKQIPPILNKKMPEISADNPDIPEAYREADGKSFLTACELVFGDSLKTVLLNRHYRCHPSIIGFCNEYVYNGQLEVMTRGAEEFRMRALWYEGDYCEVQKRGKKTARVNMRQIALFMQEEWPQLCRRMAADEKLSACVVSPFSNQLVVLQEALQRSMADTELICEEDSAEEQGEAQKLSQLTIHKAQGKGFDIVYLLTVEDYSTQAFPWCQKMRMMNVAVSRAKKEFRMIVSAAWLPEALQKAWTGYVLPRRCPETDGREELFYQKLLAYMAEKCPEPQGEFGLHRANMQSVFDAVPHKRMLLHHLQAPEDVLSAPARMMFGALHQRFSADYTILREVPMRAILQLREAEADEAMCAYKNLSRIDFMLCRENAVQLMIEVDGAQHRGGDETQLRNDAYKDEWLQTILGAGCRYRRFPTDGTTHDEMEQIAQLLEDAKNETPLITLDPEMAEHCRNQAGAQDDKMVLLLSYQNAVVRSARTLKQEMQGGTLSAALRQALCKPWRAGTRDVSKNAQLSQQLAFCRYGIAYAFEYAMMFELVLRAHSQSEQGGRLDALSFGCGALIDAWTMAYARAQLGILQVLSYKGVDVCPQQFVIVPNKLHLADKVVTPDTQEANQQRLQKLFQQIVVYQDQLNHYIADKLIYEEGTSTWRESPFLNENVLIFPKVLKDLDENKQEKMLGYFNRLRYGKNEYYLCVSHSMANKEQGTLFVKRLVDIINKKGRYEVCSNLEEMLGAAAFEAFCKTWVQGDALVPCDGNPTPHACYVFASSGTENISRISEQNSDFQCPEAQTVLKQLSDLTKQDEQLQKTRVQQLSRVGHIAFQVIRLKKKR